MPERYWKPRTDKWLSRIEEEEGEIEELQQPPEEGRPWWQRALEWATYPFAETGIQRWETGQPWYMPTITPTMPEQFTEEAIRARRSGGELYEEYQKLSWAQQMGYEVPAYAVLSLLPGAIQARGALTGRAAVTGARGYRWGATALKPMATIEKGMAYPLRRFLYKRAVSKHLAGAGIRVTGKQKEQISEALMGNIEHLRVAEAARYANAKPVLQMKDLAKQAEGAATRVVRASTAKERDKAIRILLDVSSQSSALRTNPANRIYAGALSHHTKPIFEAESFVARQYRIGPLAAKEFTLAEQIESKFVEEKAAQILPDLARGILAAVTAKAPEIIAPVTEAQVSRAKELGIDKLMINEDTGATSQGYRRLAKALTGKTSVKQMTETEAGTFIESLTRLETRFGRAPKIPIRKTLLTKEFLDKIPFLREIGAIERVRPTMRVFGKIGLLEEVWRPAFRAEVAYNEALASFDRELVGIEKSVGVDIESRRRIFRALEDPALIEGLNPVERSAYEWFSKYFNKRAVDLRIPLEKRRENYVTHIFEAEIVNALKKEKTLPPELIRALDYITPKTTFMPYLEKRLGLKLGLREDPFAAARAYEYRALKRLEYGPLIQKTRAYIPILEDQGLINSANYLRGFINRISGRPLTIDRELNQSLKEFAARIEKLPGGKALAEKLTKGNVAGLMSYQFTSLLYFLWLGFKPTSAIRNLSQNVLTFAEVGPAAMAKGMALRFKREGKEVLKESMVLRSRKQAYMPGIDTSFASRWTDRTREISLKMFRQADRINVSNAFLAGYQEAKAKGLPRDVCIKRGDEVAAHTQYIYTRIGSAAWSQSALGRILSPLTTWPENWAELMADWIGAKESDVYREYTRVTGNPVPKGEGWAKRHKALLIYLTLITGAFAVDKKTRIKALEYTGWTSLRYISEIVGGRLPALNYPYAIAQIVAGVMLQDERMLKSGWNRMKPENIMGIVRQLERIFSGETDWLTLFFYLNPEQEEKAPRLPEMPKRELPKRELPQR